MRPLLFGAGLAIGVAAFARVIGFDRERSFYPVVLVIVASYYVLFAVMAGATADVWPEMMVFVLFATAAALGFRMSPWIVVVGLAAHGLFDVIRSGWLPGSGIPQWWPAFCLAYDLTAALLLGALLRLDRRRAR